MTNPAITSGLCSFLSKQANLSLFLFAGKNISLHCLLPSLTHIKEVLRDRGFHCSKSNGPLMMVMMVMTWQESRAEVSVVPSRLGRPLLLVVCVLSRMDVYILTTRTMTASTVTLMTMLLGKC